MPRHARVLLPGVPLHVVQRGHNRQPCFLSDTDYRVYLEIVREHSVAAGCSVHAYVLMTNHVHMLLSFVDIAVAPLLIGRIGQQYSQYLNRRLGRRSTTWDGRYRSSPVPTDTYVLACQRYIEMNPVRAGMVALPEHYRWSSYRANVGLGKDRLVTPHDVYLGLASEQCGCQSAYESLFARPLTDDQLRSLRFAATANQVVGSLPRRRGRRSAQLAATKA